MNEYESIGHITPTVSVESNDRLSFLKSKYNVFFLKEAVISCIMSAGTRSNSNKREESDSVVNFLKSEEFSNKQLINKETKTLQKQIAELKTEVQILRESVDLIKLLTISLLIIN